MGYIYSMIMTDRSTTAFQLCKTNSLLMKSVTLASQLCIVLYGSTRYWKDLEFWYTMQGRWFGEFRRVRPIWNFVRCRQKSILIDEIIIIDVAPIEQHTVRLKSLSCLYLFKYKEGDSWVVFIVTLNSSLVIYIIC